MPIPAAARVGVALLLFLATASLATASLAVGQSPALSSADSSLVGRILMAEDARRVDDDALAEGLRHHDARVRRLAARARARSVDPAFAGRDSLATVITADAPPTYPDPAWRLRLRGLTAQRTNCASLAGALRDESWPVRLRAADLLGAPCAATPTVVATLQQWVDVLPRNTSRRRAGDVSWHGAAHAIVALARLAPDDSRARMKRLATHPAAPLRVYVVRAAAQLGDTAQLRQMVADADANVRTEAVDALRRLTGHANDLLYASLVADDTAPQVVRAAAGALTGSSRADAARIAGAAYDQRWQLRRVDSERDVRQALLKAAGRDTAEEASVRHARELSPATRQRAIALALGADIRVRVTMDDASGGGTFLVRLRGDVAPLMSARIAELVDARYYDGLTWHRVEHDFVIQGGSPSGNEYDGWHTFLRDELGTVSHVRGTVGMSTRGHDTGDAQWFVNLRDNQRLDRDYTMFGDVLEGIDVVDDILEGDRIARMRIEGR
jgi:cyclophilin family peptidyl-prolyl cis-trans isomerase